VLGFLAKQVIMKNITDSGGEMSYTGGSKVIHLLLRTEFILTQNLKNIQRHPDISFTLLLKQLNIKIRSMINLIRDDELGYLNAGNEGPSSHALFLYRINFIESNAAQLLMFAQSFRFDLPWCSEFFHRLEHLATRYKDAICPS